MVLHRRLSKLKKLETHRAFGARVRLLRLKAGLSQEKLADICGLDRTYVGGIERGERNPSLKIILGVATALRVQPSVLFEGWIRAAPLSDRS